MMILILVEGIMADEETARLQPNHESLQGFMGSPFPEEATQGRKPNMMAINLACGISKTTFTKEVFKEAKIIALEKNSTFLSGKERRAKSKEESALKRKVKVPSPSPPRDMPMFW